MAKERSAGFRLGLVILIGAILTIPLFMVYGLVWDRQSQSQTAQNSIAQGWGNQQVMAGPMLVIPYDAQGVETISENGKEVTRTVKVEKSLFLAPLKNSLKTEVSPERRKRSIYEAVVYEAKSTGTARFELPADLARYGVTADILKMDRAELRFGVSDARGLLSGNMVRYAGQPMPLQPGKGLQSTSGSGFFAFVDGALLRAGPVDVEYQYNLRGNGALTLVPFGGQTEWAVSSPWPHPNFTGDFLPNSRNVTEKGFQARYSVSNLALGTALVTMEDYGAPAVAEAGAIPVATNYGGGGASHAIQIGLIQPVDLYAQVNRSVKYGFLFIGFTFLAFLLFDVIGGAKVAAAEYIMVGAGLVLFFVLLLAFAEVIGFTPAYLLASGSIIALLASYSAAILRSWKRGGFVAGLLVGLYATLFVLLNLEAYSLLIGSLLMFAALATVMWATRRVDWAAVKGREEASAPEDSGVTAPIA